MLGVVPAIAGIFCMKYKENKQVIITAAPTRVILSPEAGGSQKEAKVSRIITKFI